MRVAAVNACVRVIAETVGSLPLHVYRRLDSRGKERDARHPLYRILHYRPNSWQSSIEWREMMQTHLCLRGNAYSYISRTGDGYIAELIPMHPDQVDVEQLPDFSLKYRYRSILGGGREIELPESDVFHLRGLSTDGITGRSVLFDGRDVIGSAISTQEYGARLFKNDATPGVVLEHPGTLSEKALKNLRESWDAVYSGSGNARRTAILEEGMKISRLSLSAEDSQFIETRKLSRGEIAGLFRVPPHMIGDLERATFSNIEHQAIEFVVHCIRPWLVRWEQRMLRDLFTAPDRYFPEFNVEGLLRGDIKSRYEAYAIGRNWGWLSANEIRELENKNPIPDGDEYLRPLNMQPLGEEFPREK